MGRIAFEIKQHSLGTYWLGYCSPSRSGTMDVSVKLVGSDVLPDSAVTVNASGFFEGCVETLSESCSDRVCGGFGCGSCDERGSSCQPTSGQCISFCSQHCTEPGQYTNVYGYKQACFHECDQDFIEFPRDNCPFLTDDNLTDTDGDGDGDPCDDDDDNDTWLDENDDCPLGTQNWMPMTTNDYDEDGCYDPDEDTDDDNDGVVDNVDDCPYGARNWSSNETTDYDGDGCKDDLFEDLDDDNDAIPDLLDNCPQGEPGWVTSSEEDYDQDGCRDDTEDDDDDDDLIDDNLDACPLGENTWYSNPTTDNDGDGCKDASEEDMDDDNDGFLDDNDECPQGDTLWVSSVLTDHDSDGCQDSGEDLDDDGDEKVDAEDDCPKGVLGWASNDTNDVDDDGCHDELEDLDDDNDTVEDLKITANTYQIQANTIVTINSMTLGNACDPDDDNDGLLDESDACPTGLLDWEALGDDDIDADGCRDAPFSTSILDQDNQVDLHDVEMYLSAGEVIAQFIDPSAHGDLTEYRIHNLFPERPTSFKITLYRISEPVIPGDGWDFVMTNENILYQGNHVVLMDQTRLDVYFPVPQWVLNDSQIAMVMEVLGEAIVTEGETPSGAVVPNADGANLIRLGLTTSNKYPRGFLLDQDLRTDPTGDDLEFELYFIPEEDLDDDNDSVADEEDNCPFTVNLGQLNNDADAQGDLCDDDDDNDGKLDEEDDCSKGETDWVSNEENDNDNDGCKDDSNEDPDDDNDTIPDIVDNCQFIVNANQENVDLDQWGRL